MNQRNVLRATVLRVLCISGTVLACCVTAGRSEIPEDELEELVARIKPSVVRVHTFRISDRRWWYGSGFFINKWGDVITNAHVVGDAGSIHVQTQNGSWFRVNQVLVMDEEADLALLSVNIPRNMIRCLLWASKLPLTGDDVVLVSAEPANEPEVLEGEVTAVCAIPGMGRFVAVRAGIRGGWSGSAVVNTSGQVVGAVTAYLPGRDGYCRAAPSQAIQWVIAQRGFSFFEHQEELLDLSLCTASELEYGARISSWSGDYREAIYYCNLALEKDPDFFDALVLAAWCHKEMDEHEEAIDFLERARRLRPEDAEVYSRLAWSFEKIGHEEEMISCYQRAVQLEPGDWFNRFWLGYAYERRNEYAKAVSLYEEGVRLRPGDSTMYVNLADAYMGLGRHAEAAQSLQKAIQLDPDYSLPHQNMGAVLVALGNHPDAVMEYEEALRLDPTNGFIISALGRCYLALGDLWRAAGRYWVLKSSGDFLAGLLAEDILHALREIDDE